MEPKRTYRDGTTPTICIIGAGFSGLLAGIKLKTELGIDNYTIFDENSDVGGTWLVNTYPGCACDVQSHLYSYSFELNPNWSQNYAPQAEIWEYLQGVARKYDLYPSIKFHSQVKLQRWDSEIGKWRLTIWDKKTESETEFVFDIVISSPGALRVPNVPEEFDSFKGFKLHSAIWDKSINLDNKIVGIVGSGSSAIQLIPEIAPRVNKLHSYQRKPAWVMPRLQRKFPSAVKKLFATLPFVMILFRWFLFLFHEVCYQVFAYGSTMNNIAHWLGKTHLKTQIPVDKKRCRDLIPNYRVGCKRIMVSDVYYPAMARPNVVLHREPILKIKEDSITTVNGEEKLDVLILATGYRVQDFFKPMEIIGKDSTDVFLEWKTAGPRSLLGIMSPLTPNQFILLGPNTGLGHNSIIFMVECQMNYIIQLLSEMIRRDARLIEVKDSVVTGFQNSVEKDMSKTVWGQENCGSWYADAKGRITTLWPSSCINYWWKTRVANFSHYKFK